METTLTNTFSLTAQLSSRTGLGCTALLLVLFTHTGNIGIACEAAGTETSVASCSVVTEGSFATGFAKTLIDVNTSLETRTSRLVTLVAHTPGFSIEQGTQ